MRWIYLRGVFVEAGDWLKGREVFGECINPEYMSVSYVEYQCAREGGFIKLIRA